MATFVGAGSGDVLQARQRPRAVIVPDAEIGVIGSVVKLDGTVSLDGDGGGLSYEWSFVTAPIGSQVAQEGFRKLDEGGGLVSFSPDRVGEYIVKLRVWNEHFEDSTTQAVSIRAILVPDGRGIVPDGKFVWSYIRDVWQQVENREVFETLWSVLIQLCGSELVKAYQVDFNKSIRDIQEKMQRRWLSYGPRVLLDDEEMTAFIGGECAGVDGTTEVLGQSGKAVILTAGELVVIEGSVLSDAPSPITITYSRGEDNLGQYEMLGTNAGRTGYRLASPVPQPEADIVASDLTPTFAFQSKVWQIGGGEAAPNKQYALRMSMYPSPVDQLIPTFASGAGGGVDIRPGDVVHIPAGINQGLYRVTRSTGTFIEVDRAPPSSSTADLVTVYRPVGFRLPALPVRLTNTFAIPATEATKALGSIAPGRLVNIGARSFVVFRSYLDDRQAQPLYVVTTDSVSVVPGLPGQTWRVPNTLVSKTIDFEAIGVASGDLLVFDITDEDSNSLAEVEAQVLGVSGNRLGFVITTEPLVPGEHYETPERVFDDAAQALGIGSIVTLSTGAVRRTGDAKRLLDFLGSIEFRSRFWNKELRLADGIETPVGLFHVRPKAIIRNSHIPVDETLLSVPVLQEWIRQPEVQEHDGKVFQVRAGKEFELKRRPTVLIEGNDYLIDGATAYDDLATFRTGTNVLEIDGSSLRDRRVAPGDVVTILEPAVIAADYVVVEVLGQDKVLLSTEIPYLYPGIVSAQVTITRRRLGTFLRFVPGRFTPKSPAPDRLWAEVSHFDNSEAIESNFGIMVGLTRRDLERISPHATYRQAVAGLMFAYTRGAAIEKIRLGAQILLGLPFSEHRGIIRSIDPDYRLNAYGEPVLGRILVEDVDEDGNAVGVQRVYTYPIDLESSELSGIETNPATGKQYQVGDRIELFAPLARGVKVSDYLSDPDEGWPTAQAALQKYHSFKLVANDNIFDLKEVELVSKFLRRITPSYVSFILSDAVELADKVQVQDFLSLRLGFGQGGGGSGLVDNIAAGINTAFMFDQRTFGGSKPLIFWGDGLFRMRQSGVRALTSNFSAGSVVVERTIASPIARAGDYLQLLTGPNQGRYRIAQAVDAVLQLDQPVVFATAENQEWMVVRKVEGEFRRGVVIDSGRPAGAPATTWFTVEPGVIEDGVMYGDWLLLERPDGRVQRFIVVGTEPNRIRVLGTSPFVVLTDGGDPVTNNAGETVEVIEGPATYRVYRPCFIESPTEAAFELVSDGVEYTSMDPWAAALLDPRDELSVDDVGYELFVLNPATRAIQPVLPAGTYSVHLKKVNAQPAPIGFDFLGRWNIQDQVDLKLIPQGNISSVASQRNITLPDAEPLPGDLLQFLDANQVDVGFGVGMFPIVAVHSNSSVDLAYPMADTGSSRWALIRRR